MPKKVKTKKAERKITEALRILELLGFPRRQVNERSALTLLSLLALKPEAALVLPNPDRPSRPTNSPKAVYQIETSALKLLREFSKPTWKGLLREYLKSVKMLKRLYARERQMRRIPLILRSGKQISLSPGGQNVLIKKIIEDFCPLFTPAGHVIYVGDTQKK